MQYTLKPIACRPWLLQGLSQKLVESHYDHCRAIPLAQPSAPKKAAIAGFISRKPKRTMMIETTAATTAKMARLRDQVARLDTGSDW